MTSPLHVPLAILGSGPAGLTAALYAARASLQPLIIRGQTPGGQVTSSDHIENFPGFPEGISGFDLAYRMEMQAQQYGARYLDAFVIQLDLTKRPFVMHTDDGQVLTSDQLVLATGSTPKTLGIPAESRLQHRGVEHCATCDGPLYAEQTVVVVGGGNTAFTDALQLSRYAAQVHLIHRSGHYRAEQVLQEQVRRTHNIHLHPHTRLLDINGTEEVEQVVLENLHTREIHTLATRAVFMCIGSVPNSQLVEGQLELAPDGSILTDPDTRTRVEGVYAVGEVTDRTYRQAITSAADGAKAALQAIQMHMLQNTERNTP